MAGSCAYQSSLRRNLSLSRVASYSVLRLLAISREVLHHFMRLKILHEVQDRCCVASPARANTCVKVCPTKLSPIFSRVSVTVFGDCLESTPTASQSRQVSHTINRSPSALVSCAELCFGRDHELVFHFLPTFLIFCCLDPHYCFFQRCLSHLRFFPV